MSNLKKEQILVLIKGRVQGVLMRRAVKEKAESLNLTGQARNLTDGSIEVIAEGTKASLDDLLDWCYKGSRLARVESLAFNWGAYTGSFQGFNIIRQGTFIEDKLSALKNLSKTVAKKILIPKHVVIIPDGNRRWAKSHKLETVFGHEQGGDTANNLMEEALRMKIPYFTLWGFSTENWNRPKREINFLMNLSRRYLKRLKEKLFSYQVGFRHFGRKDRLPKDILLELDRLENDTRDFSRAHFGLAFDYGGRDELIRATQKIQKANEKISEATLSQALDTKDFPDPDLIIRTSGEMRLSGLMPWQGTYSELFFSPVLFPDFNPAEFRKVIAEFGRRKRNFGQ